MRREISFGFRAVVGVILVCPCVSGLGLSERGGGSVFDLGDYAAFAECLSGPGIDVGDACIAFDLDHDGDVDVVDAARVQHVFGVSVPPGMVFIPPGPFQMGDTFNEGVAGERPVHAVYLDAYYMDQFEVTKELWDTVRGWALAQGYDLNAGYSRAPNHPVHDVNWYQSAKWCNARSQQEGRTPCYYTGPGLTTVYKTGEMALYVKWNADGYRLPTEAEWERAARGGVPGHRFPWSDADTIQHARANYYSSSVYPYDTSATRGNHPDVLADGWPYSTPVGHFAPNGFGLFDMTGNVSEWCNDWYSETYYLNSPDSNPTGPATGTHRIIRGGGWQDVAKWCRTATHVGFPPRTPGSYIGFRCVLRTQ